MKDPIEPRWKRLHDLRERLRARRPQRKSWLIDWDGRRRYGVACCGGAREIERRKRQLERGILR